MEIGSKRKVTTRTWEEKKTLCEQWKASGKTKSEFCKENDIPLATFFPWCNKLWPKPKNKEERNILPVKIIKETPMLLESQAQTEIELILGGGSHLRFKLPIKNLITFIQELSNAAAIIR